MKKNIIDFFKSKKYTGQDKFLRFLSLGLIGIGTAGLILSSKYSTEKKANLTFILDNLFIVDNSQQNDMEAMNEKVVFLSGNPSIQFPASDHLFNITIDNCAYLRRYSQMYQNYYETDKSKNNSRLDFRAKQSLFGNIFGSRSDQRVDQKWSSFQENRGINPIFPLEFRSMDFHSSPIVLNSFKIDPVQIRSQLKSQEFQVNYLENGIFENLSEKLKNTGGKLGKYKWMANRFYIYGAKFDPWITEIGNIRISHYCLKLNQGTGISIIGQIENGIVRPISLMKTGNILRTEVFPVKMAKVTPSRLIADELKKVAMKYFALLLSSGVLLSLGVYYSNLYISNPLARSLVPIQNNNWSIIKFLPKDKKIIFISQLIGLSYGLVIYHLWNAYQKRKIYSTHKIRNIKTFRSLANQAQSF